MAKKNTSTSGYSIEEILDCIYNFEDLVAIFPKDEDNRLINYLTGLTKLISKFDVIKELCNTDCREFDDEKLKTLRDALHNMLLEIDRELYKRHIP